MLIIRFPDILAVSREEWPEGYRENIPHADVGIMLDTSHLVNTNPQLTTGMEGSDYIMEKLCQLGEFSEYILGFTFIALWPAST